MSTLSIPKTGALDFLSLGALAHRLDPGLIPFRKATECQIHVGGGEFNVAANLSDCFRLNTGVATARIMSEVEAREDFHEHLSERFDLELLELANPDEGRS